MADELYNSRSPGNLSDYSGSSSRNARKVGYSDLDFSLALHPFKKDIMPLKDDRAIRNSIKNILNTDSFERPFQQRSGAGLRELLFEPISFITENLIETKVKGALSREPRIEVLKVAAKGDEKNNLYDISIKFKIKANNGVQTLPIILRRLR